MGFIKDNIYQDADLDDRHPLLREGYLFFERWVFRTVLQFSESSTVPFLLFCLYWIVQTQQQCSFMGNTFLGYLWESDGSVVFMKMVNFVSFFKGQETSVSSFYFALASVLGPWVQYILATLLEINWSSRFGFVFVYHAIVQSGTIQFFPTVFSLLQIFLGCLNIESNAHAFISDMTCWSGEMYAYGIFGMILTLGAVFNALIVHMCLFPRGIPEDQNGRDSYMLRIYNRAEIISIFVKVGLLVLFLSGKTDSWKYPMGLIMCASGALMTFLHVYWLEAFHDLVMGMYISTWLLVTWCGLNLIIISSEGRDMNGVALFFFTVVPILFFCSVILVRWRYINAFSQQGAEFHSGNDYVLISRAQLRAYVLSNSSYFYWTTSTNNTEVEITRARVQDRIDTALEQGVQRFPHCVRLRLFRSYYFMLLRRNRMLSVRDLAFLDNMETFIDIRFMSYILHDVLSHNSSRSKEVEKYLEFKSRKEAADSCILDAASLIVQFWSAMLVKMPGMDSLTSLGHLAKSRVQQGIVHYKRQIEINPNSIPVMRTLGYLHGYLTGDIRQSMDYLEKVHDLEVARKQALDRINDKGFMIHHSTNNDIFDEDNAVISISLTEEHFALIEGVNRTAVKLLGFDSSMEMEGKNIDIIMPREQGDPHDQIMHNWIQRRSSNVVDKTRTVFARNITTNFIIPVDLHVRWGGEFTLVGVIAPIHRMENECYFMMDVETNIVTGCTKELLGMYGFSKRDMLNHLIHIQEFIPIQNDFDGNSMDMKDFFKRVCKPQGQEVDTRHIFTGRSWKSHLYGSLQPVLDKTYLCVKLLATVTHYDEYIEDVDHVTPYVSSDHSKERSPNDLYGSVEPGFLLPKSISMLRNNKKSNSLDIYGTQTSQLYGLNMPTSPPAPSSQSAIFRGQAIDSSTIHSSYLPTTNTPSYPSTLPLSPVLSHTDARMLTLNVNAASLGSAPNSSTAASMAGKPPLPPSSSLHNHSTTSPGCASPSSPPYQEVVPAALPMISAPIPKARGTVTQQDQYKFQQLTMLTQPKTSANPLALQNLRRLPSNHSTTSTNSSHSTYPSPHGMSMTQNYYQSSNAAFMNSGNMSPSMFQSACSTPSNTPPFLPMSPPRTEGIGSPKIVGSPKIMGIVPALHVPSPKIIGMPRSHRDMYENSTYRESASNTHTDSHNSTFRNISSQHLKKEYSQLVAHAQRSRTKRAQRALKKAIRNDDLGTRRRLWFMNVFSFVLLQLMFLCGLCNFFVMDKEIDTLTLIYRNMYANARKEALVIDAVTFTTMHHDINAQPGLSAVYASSQVHGGTAPANVLPAVTYSMMATMTEMHELNTVLNIGLNSYSSKSTNYLNDRESISVEHLVGNKPTTTRMGADEATRTLISCLNRYLTLYTTEGITRATHDGCYWWLTANGPLRVRNGIAAVTARLLVTFDVFGDALVLQPLWFLIVSMFIMLTITWFLVIPLVVRVENGKSHVIHMFLEIPRPVRRALRRRAFALYSLLLKEEEHKRKGVEVEEEDVLSMECDQQALDALATDDLEAFITVTQPSLKTHHKQYLDTIHKTLHMEPTVAQSQNRMPMSRQLSHQTLSNPTTPIRQLGMSPTVMTSATSTRARDVQGVVQQVIATAQGKMWTFAGIMNATMSERQQHKQKKAYGNVREHEGIDPTEHQHTSVWSRKTMKGFLFRYLQFLVLVTCYYSLLIGQSRLYMDRGRNYALQYINANKRFPLLQLGWLNAAQHQTYDSDALFASNPHTYQSRMGGYVKTGVATTNEAINTNRDTAFGLDGLVSIESSAFKHLLFENPCGLTEYEFSKQLTMMPKYFPATCHLAARKTLQKGAYSVFQESAELIESLLHPSYKGFLQYYQDMSLAPVDVTLEMVNVVVERLREASEQVNYYLKAQYQFNTKQVHALAAVEVDSWNQYRVVSLVVYCVALLLFYILALRTTAAALTTDASKTKSQLLLIAPDIIRHSMQVQDYIELHLLEE